MLHSCQELVKSKSSIAKPNVNIPRLDLIPDDMAANLIDVCRVLTGYNILLMDGWAAQQHSNRLRVKTANRNNLCPLELRKSNRKS